MKTKISVAAAAACLYMFANGAAAHEFVLGEITIDHPIAFETAPGARAGGGFMTITNAGTESDRLIAARAEYPRVELHTTREEDGVSKMIHLDAIEIPAGESVTFEPGSYHVMFMGLGEDRFEPGESIPATLVFEKAGEVVISFTVETRGDTAGMNHSGH